MELLEDIRFWSFALSAFTFIGVIIAGIINKMASDKIANNHLSHIADDLKEIKGTQEKQDKKISGIELNMAYVRGQIDSNDKIVQILEKSIRN